jgi:hypothetical protein
LEAKTDFVPEHVFPEALGGNLTIDVVCTGCNHWLGSNVDARLTDHWLIQARRRELRLSGKGGKLPKVRMTGTVDGMPDVRVVMEFADDDNLTVRVQTLVRSATAEDGTQFRQVLVDEANANRLPQIVNKIRERAGMSRLSGEDIERLHPRHRFPQPRVTMGPDVDLHDYRRAIIKIAYELAHRWLGDAYITDATAGLMRGIILNSNFAPEDFERSGLRGQILLGQVLPELPFDASACLLAYMIRQGEQVALCIQIFDLFQACLTVSECGGRYRDPPDMAVLIEARNGKLTEAGLGQVLSRVVELARQTSG